MHQFVYEEAFVQTHGNLLLICNDCLRPSGYFSDLVCEWVRIKKSFFKKSTAQLIFIDTV